nr:MAG TPA: hypothetical protein [Caudoviricetes sp.]
MNLQYYFFIRYHIQRRIELQSELNGNFNKIPAVSVVTLH